VQVAASTSFPAVHEAQLAVIEEQVTHFPLLSNQAPPHFVHFPSASWVTQLPSFLATQAAALALVAVAKIKPVLQVKMV
jgi:hypothetical protein